MRRFSLSSAALCALTFAATPAFAELPAVRIMQADLMDPTAANAWYPSATGHANSVCILIPNSDLCAGRPMKIKALARSLGADRYNASDYAQHVLEYMYANIDTEFRYGLSKGALGTLLDQSGTPFDQANLMVELLREGQQAAQQTATYEVGTITLNAAQFTAWTGITNATAACRLLADGGIPASINGSTTANCAYGSAAVTTVTLSHIWVAANSKYYDPSYKTYTQKPGVDLATATGCGASCATTLQSTAIPTGATYQGFDATAQANYVQNVQTSALGGLLNGTYATNLQSYIQGNTPGAAVEDVAGGRVINNATIPVASGTFPYTKAMQRQWTGDVPDAYRSTLRVQVDGINQTLYADELSGYWLTIEGGLADWQAASTTRYTELTLHAPNASGAFSAFGYTLVAATPAVRSWTSSGYTLELNHPYYAASTSGGTAGTYMDETVSPNIWLVWQFSGYYEFIPVQIIAGWGRSGPGLASQAANDAGSYRYDPNSVSYGDTHNACVGSSPTVLCSRVTDGTLAIYGATWLAQAGKGMRLVDGINHSITEHHHTLGAMAVIGSVSTTDGRSSISVTSTSNNAVDRQAAAASNVALLSTLEGSAGEQTNDSWGAYSGVGLFALANEKQHRFYDVTSTNVESVLAATTNFSATDKSYVRSYVNNASPAYRGILSQNGTIGTFAWGNWSTSFPFTPFYAYSTDGTREAYISTARIKGSGTATTGIDNIQKSVDLTDPMKKREPDYSVDLASGFLSYAAAPDLVTGQGAFPYSLPFQRFYSPADAQPTTIYYLQDPLYSILDPVWERPNDLNAGWRHKYEIFAQIGNDGFQAMGADSGLDASATLAGLYALRALNAGTQTFQSRATAIYVAAWLAQQFVDNTVVIKRPPAGGTFVRLPSGVYNPPPGSQDIVTRSGARARVNPGSLLFSYGGIQVTWTDESGNSISFSPGDKDQFTSGPVDVFANRLKADTWTFADGMRINFTYAGEFMPSGDDGSHARWRMHLASVANSIGRSLTFARSDPSDSGVTFLVTDDTGRAVRAYTSNVAYQIDVVDGGGGRHNYSVAGAHTLTGAELNGAVLTQVFDPASATVPVFTAAYDSLNRVTSITDRSSHVANYYAARVSTERLARGEIVDGMGGLKTTYFDTLANPVQSIDEIGRITNNVYDGVGRLTKRVMPEGNAIQYTYDGRLNVTEERRKPKSGTADIFTSATFPPTCANPKSCNKPLTATDSRGNATTYTYNTLGQLLTVTGPAVTGGNALTTWGYQSFTANGGVALSLPVSRTDQIDATTSTVTAYTYDTLANKLAPKTMTVDAGGLNLTTTPAYDAVGNVISITNPRSKVSSYCFDAMRRLTRVTKQIGTLDAASCASLPAASGDDIVTLQEFDADGYLTKLRRKDAAAGAWRDTLYGYTANRLVNTVTDPQGNVTRYDYDASDRITMQTDGAGRKTRTFFFPDGKVRKILKGYAYAATDYNEECSVAGTDQQCYAQYTYAPLGQSPANYDGGRYSVTDANNHSTTYSYDLHDRLSVTTFNDGSHEDLTYDNDNSVLTLRNRANQTIVYTYDTMGRPSTKAHSSFPAVTFGYDLFSRRTSANQMGGQALSWIYDKAGRVSSATAESRTLNYQYDENGTRTRLTWPDSVFVDYTYDDAGRMDLVKDNTGATLVDYNWDTLSRRVSVTHANGHASSYTYEPDGDIGSITYSGLPSTPQISLLHNGAHQITQETTNLSSIYWVAPAQTTAYVPTALNTYSSVGGVTANFDSKGNYVGDGTVSYSYDAENRLLSQAQSGITTSSYQYDGLGRRYAKVVGGTGTRYLLDADEEVAEYDDAGSVLRRYVPGSAVDEHVVMYEGSGVAAANRRFYYTNYQGSTLYVADNSGAIVSSFSYGPFGESSTLTGNPFRFTGRRFDAETGLYYYRARYYSPTFGRFLQPDPVGYDDEMNLYAYVSNDPLNRTDPSGRYQCTPLPGSPSRLSCRSKPGFDHWIMHFVLWWKNYAVVSSGDEGQSSPDKSSGEAAPEPTTPSEAGVPDSVTGKIPGTWGQGQANKKKVGWRWRDPDNRGNGVRWDKGDPRSRWRSQREDHVRVDKDGKVIGRDGQPIEPTAENPNPASTEGAHIPASEYEKWLNWGEP
jgi:RHS repeat-associated protein